MGSSTSSAVWATRSRIVGKPSPRSPPPTGFGIITRRTGSGRYVFETSASRTRQPDLQTRRLDLPKAHPVHARSTRVATGQPVGVAQDIFATDLLVEHVEAESRLRLRLAVQLSLQGPDLLRCYQAHRQSPSPHRFESAPEVRALCSAGIARPRRSYDPVRLPPWPSPGATLRPLPSHRTGLPRLPEPPSRRAVPTTPADRAGARVDCFPARAGYGPPDRSAAHRRPLSRGSKPMRLPA